MQKYNTHTWGYSIIAAILMVGFLLVLTVGTLNLVLAEMQDGTGRHNYMKAYAWAEWAMELWLLRIKDSWYGYYDSFTGSTMIWTWPKNARVSLDFQWRVSLHNGELDAYEIDIIPLFWIDTSGSMHDVGTVVFNGSADMAWNIIGRDGGISGVWAFTNTTEVWEKIYDEVTGILSYDSTRKVWEFLSAENYLVVHNTSASNKNYSLEVWAGEYFTLPRSDILSSGKVWKYSQNLRTEVDNTEFLWILKYSIYSWN